MSLLCEEVSFRYSKRSPWILERFSHTFAPGIILIKGASE